MKKAIMILVFLFSFGLFACETELTDIEKLNVALENLKTESNYQIHLIIADSNNEYEAIIKFDDNVTYYQAGSTIEYYEYANGNENTYALTKDGYVKTSKPAKEVNSKYAFINNLKSDDFSFVNGRYLLKYGKDKAVNDFIQLAIKDGTNKNFSLTIEDSYVNKASFTIVGVSDTYSVTMNYSLYGDVSLTLPTVL